MTLRRWWIVLLLLWAPLAQAVTPATGAGNGVHAFLDRSHVSLGDTVTLNLQSDGALGDPDLSVLQKDFEVLGTSRSSSVQIVNGKSTATSQLGIALKPLHAGTLTIPALEVGTATTQPLTLEVGAAPSGGSGRTGDPVFMETNVQSSSPYVGQQIVYTVRLFYLPGVNGALGDPGADGARLIPLDRDHRYVTERDGYAYKVIERSWALIPQRSGSISVQGPVFEGQQLGPGFPNAWFNNPNALLNSPLHGLGGAVRATAPVVRIDARAQPAGAGQPWLPARDVQLKLSGLPANGKLDAASPLTVTLTISAEGQPADALPQPELPPISGARIYPDQVQDATDDSGQWLHGTRMRSFAIVPDRNGALTLPAITLDWWDVAHARAEQARVPAHTLQVSGVVATAAPPVAPPAVATARTASDVATRPPAPAAVRPSPIWKALALASLALWLIAIVAAGGWVALRRRRRAAAVPSGVAGGDRMALRTGASKPVAAESLRGLQRETLDAARSGDAAACERCLLAWARVARPLLVHAGLLRGALSDPAQRDAWDALQRARWQGGDAASACAMVARAFAHGFVWRKDAEPAGPDAEVLPPLYPPRG